MDWATGVKALEIPEGNVKQIAVNGVVLWRAPSGVTYTPILPNDSQYPLYDNRGYAVTNGQECGYYNPVTQTFVKVSGMIGTVIERCEYVSFGGSQYVNTGVELKGSDSVVIDFTNLKSGANIFGSWRSSNTNVYSFYASATSSYVRYNSSLYRNTPIALNTRMVFRMTPTGDYVGNTRYHTWEQSDFATDTPCLVGWLANSSSPKANADVYDFKIVDKCHLIPVKIGASYYLFDVMRWLIPTHTGALDGGDVIDVPIPFPDD